VEALLQLPSVVVQGALSTCVAQGSLACLHLLLSCPRADVNEVGPDGTTVLATACRTPRIDMVDALLLHDAIDVQKSFPVPGHPGQTATVFHYTVDASILDRLLRVPGVARGGALNLQTGGGDTPLMAIVRRGDVACLTVLLRQPYLLPNSSDSKGRTALYLAAKAGYLECVIALTGDSRVDVNRVNRKGASPLHAAVLRGHLQCAEALLAQDRIHGNICDFNGRSPFFCAVVQATTREDDRTVQWAVGLPGGAQCVCVCVCVCGACWSWP
jgi:ankyrin repeat protein